MVLREINDATYSSAFAESIHGMETFRNSVKTFSRLELLFTLSLCIIHVLLRGIC